MTRKRTVFYGNDNDNVFAASPGSDTVYGYGGDDLIFDTNSNTADFYYGGKGNDVIHTESGNDYIEGNNGRDRVISSNYADFTFDGGAGADTIEFQVLFGHSYRVNDVTDEKTVIKVFDDASGDMTQKVILWNVETIEIWMIG